MQTVPILRKNERPDNSEITLIMIILDGIRANAESEETEIMFKNERHKVLFEEAVRKKNKKDNALMAVIYLLTSDFRLWNIVKHHIEKSSVDFGSIKLKGIHESGLPQYSFHWHGTSTKLFIFVWIMTSTERKQ